MKTFIALTALAIAFAYSAATPPEQNSGSRKDGEISPYLNFVASSDGKSFFVDTTLRNWTLASTYCQSLDMRLASITSAAQRAALTNATSSHFPVNTVYWTAGRDAKNINQFLWNGTSTILGSHNSMTTLYNFEHMTCVLFYHQSVSATYLTFDKCSVNHQVMCETL